MFPDQNVDNNREQDYELSSLEENDGESSREILHTDSIDSTERKLRNIWKISRSKTGLVRLVSEYKFLALSCSLALLGLIITIRMVGSQENTGSIFHFLLSC